MNGVTMANKKKLFFSIIFLVTIQTFSLLSVDLQVGAFKHARIKLLICTLGKKNKEIKMLAQRMQRDLSFTRQFEVKLGHFPSLPRKKDIHAFFTQGFPLIIFLNEDKKNNSFVWRLYDGECQTMIIGKNYKKRGGSFREWAHHIADAVWPTLTGQLGMFSTKIAYCKEVRRPNKKSFKHIYVADYDGTGEKLLISTSTVNVAPRWNRDKHNPLLFYSEHTNKNVRLMVVDMNGRRKVVSDFDGLNMLPAFSADGKRAVFCASRADGTCQLYYFEKGVFKKLTSNRGNNIAPVFSQDGKTLFFCSDFETRLPQIYSYAFDTGKIGHVTQRGYCVSPSCSPCNDKLAYAKMVQGTMQIFVYDFATKKHKQVTFDAGNKEECSWSPCGNYLMFAVETPYESRLVMLNLISNDRRYITPGRTVCCYPTWSSPYRSFWGA
jgi:TolB protein